MGTPKEEFINAIRALEELSRSLSQDLSTSGDVVPALQAVSMAGNKVRDARVIWQAAVNPNDVDVLKTETCRECRDELPYGSKLPLAEFILWGKYNEPEAFGPKCYDHAQKYFNVNQADQYAVYDLRPINALTAR